MCQIPSETASAADYGYKLGLAECCCPRAEIASTAMDEDTRTRRVAVVSGGSRGLGLETARHLAHAGWSIALCSRNSDRVKLVASELAERYGVPTLGAAVDVGSWNEVEQLAQRVQSELGHADVLINNAAVLGPVGPLAADATAAWSTAIDINVKGAAYMIAAFTPHLSHSGRGRVVNLSGGGVGGPRPSLRVSAYIASKFAVVGLTEVIAQELAPAGVTVNAISPGALPTAFMDGVLAAGPDVAGSVLHLDAATRTNNLDDAVRPYLLLLDYLLSDDAAEITGRMLSVRWETPDRLSLMSPPIARDLFRLRRIDDDLFGALQG